VTLDLVSSVVVVSLHGLNQLVQGGAVIGLDLGDGHARSSLPPTDEAQPGLVLDDVVGHPHLAAHNSMGSTSLAMTSN